MDVTLSPDQYFRSDFYTCDERVEVTGSRGDARCNRISAYGVQEPSVVVYAEGEMRGYHALADTPPDAFRASTAHGLDVLTNGTDAIVMSAAASCEVLAALEAAVTSAREGTAVDVQN